MKRVLFVDDEPAVLDGIRRNRRAAGRPMGGGVRTERGERADADGGHRRLM